MNDKLLETIKQLNIENGLLYRPIYGTKKEVESLSHIIHKSEHIYFMTPGIWRSWKCLAVTTNERIILIQKLPFSPLKVKSISIDDVYSPRVLNKGKEFVKLQFSNGIERINIFLVLPNDATRFISSINVAQSQDKNKYSQRDVYFKLRKQ